MRVIVLTLKTATFPPTASVWDKWVYEVFSIRLKNQLPAPDRWMLADYLRLLQARANGLALLAYLLYQ